MKKISLRVPDDNYELFSHECEKRGMDLNSGLNLLIFKSIDWEEDDEDES